MYECADPVASYKCKQCPKFQSKFLIRLKHHNMNNHSSENEELAMSDLKCIKKQRAKKFTEQEISTLIAEVAKRKQILYGKIRPNLTRHHKAKAWEIVLRNVNAIAPARRTVPEIKKKFKDLKSRTKNKATAVKSKLKRANGNANVIPKLTPAENEMLTFIGLENIKNVTQEVNSCSKVLISPPPLRPILPLQNPIPKVEPKLEPPSLEEMDEVTDEIKKLAILQLETRKLLGQLVQEFREFKNQFGSQFEQYLELKRREVELMKEAIELKKRRYMS